MSDNWQVLSGCGVYDGTELHEASAYVNAVIFLLHYTYVDNDNQFQHSYISSKHIMLTQVRCSRHHLMCVKEM